jgi:hypothetical protein
MCRAVAIGRNIMGVSRQDDQGMAFGQLAELFRAHLASSQLLPQDLPVCSRSRFAECFHKALTVPIVEDNVFAARYVIPGSRTQFAFGCGTRPSYHSRTRRQ